MSDVARCVILAVALAAGARSAVAQVVRGRVAIIETADAIAGAAVVLTTPDGTPHAAGLSDSLGWFELTAPAAGHYIVRAYAPGFAEVRSAPVDVPAGRIVEVRVTLRPVAVVLEGVTVYGENRYYEFHERRQLPQSYRFRSFDASDIERIGAGSLKDVLSDVPLGRGRCYTFWLDGRRLESDRRFGRDWLVAWLLGELEGGGAFPVTSFYGIEVFRNRGEAPRQYTIGGDAYCGVVLVWTNTLGFRRD